MVATILTRLDYFLFLQLCVLLYYFLMYNYYTLLFPVSDGLKKSKPTKSGVIIHECTIKPLATTELTYI